MSRVKNEKTGMPLKNNMGGKKSVRKWLTACTIALVAVCLSASLFLANVGQPLNTAYADEVSNIVNTNIGMHPKWEFGKCVTVEDGGVGDTYTSAHKIWRVSTDGTNDPLMEKSPSYVFTGDEAYAEELIETYNLRKGNEVVFNITSEDTAAKVWADAIAFAQSIGKDIDLVEHDLANDCKGDGTSGKNETHNGWRVGSNIGERNRFKGNFFLDNSNGALGQYITVRLQTDWKAKEVTANIPQTVKKVTDNSKGDYIEISGDTKSLKTTTFDYIKTEYQAANGNYLWKDDTGTTNYLDSLGKKDDFNKVTDFNLISTNGDYTLSYDLASNGFDYDWSNHTTQAGQDTNARKPENALNVFNDTCAFSFGRLHIPTGVYIVLDLNGHTIDRNLAGEGNGDPYGSVISVSNVARLEVMDSTAYENASSARIENKDGEYTTNHTGTITGGHISGQVVNNITDNEKISAFPNDMRLKFQYMGAAVNIAPWGDFVMDSGTVKGNQVESKENGSTGGSGGAFYQRSKAAVTIFDGYVIDNDVSNKGGVTILGDGSGCAFTMYGGVLAQNKAGLLGGAVHLGTSTYANFHGGEIVNNTAGQKGGAINLFANTLGILDSVTITGNKVTADITNEQNEIGHGGAIYIDYKTYTVDAYRKENGYGPGFQFRGSLQIYGNTVGTSNKEENVFLSYMDKDTYKNSNKGSEQVGGSGIPTVNYQDHFAQIAIGGPLISNGIVANVGVTLGKYDTDAANNVFTSGYGKEDNGGVDTFLYFHSDKKDYAVINQGDSTTREATLGQASSVKDDGGLTWVIEGTGTDADTDLSDESNGESILKIVINSDGEPTFYYKNPKNTHGLNNALTQVTGGSLMNTTVPLTQGGDPTNKLLNILKDRFQYSNGSLTFEYSMLKVTKISAYTGTPIFTASGDNLTASGGTLLRTWVSQSDGNKYTITNNFENANFRFKMGEKDLTASSSGPSKEMSKAIGATDGSISYAGEYSVLVSDNGKRYTNPSFKIRINQVGVEVDRSLYYKGQDIENELKWLKDIDWDGSGQTADSGEHAKLGKEKNQPYFIYTGEYYYPILNADYNRLTIFNLYNPFDKSYTTVSKDQFTGYVLEFTYANEYFGKDQPVKFGSHSGGGIEYQTMHRQPGKISGIGTYVPGVKNAGMYEVQFVSSRSAQSADDRNADYSATGVYFAANNFAFSSKVNIYVDPATAEVELTKQAKEGFTYSARAIPDTEIVIYDNTSNTHVNPHLDDAATLEYYLFDSLKLKAGIYDTRTKLYYTLDQVATKEAWDKVRPYGREIASGDDSEQENKAKAEGRPYFPSYMDNELMNAPVVLWNKDSNKHFDPVNPGTNITAGILNEDGLKEFEELYKRTVDRESTGKLVYIVDKTSFDSGEGKAKKLDGNPTDARRYVVFVTLDLDVGYDDYNYIFDQDAEHLVGLDDDTSYFWAFEFTVSPAEIDPLEGSSVTGGSGKNTAVSITKDVWYNGDSYGYEATYGKNGVTFDEKTLSKQAILPTISYYGLGVGSELTLNEDYKIEYVSFNESPDGKSKFNYLDASVGLDASGPIFGTTYHFGAYNLAIKITFGGSNMNYVNAKRESGSADGKGTAYEDGEGAFYVYFRICPIVVTASGSMSYTYDGGSFDRARYLPPRTGKDESDAWFESIFFLVQDGINTPTELIDHQHEKSFELKDASYPEGKRDLDDLWGGVNNVGDTIYGDTDFYKGRYTLGNVSVSYSDEAFKTNEVAFGLGVYSFKTERPDYSSRAYHLTTADYDEQGETPSNDGSEGYGVGIMPDNIGVTWLLTTIVDGKQVQSFNSSTNFIMGSDSWLEVTINQKDISNDFGSIIKFGDKEFAHVSASAGTKLTSEETGVEYPFAGSDWGYFPTVTFNYVPSFVVKGASDAEDVTKYYDFGKTYNYSTSTYKENPLEITLSGKERAEFSGITVTYTGNTAVSKDGAIVRVNGVGNYTGTFRLKFEIVPAEIVATMTNATEKPHYDMNPHKAEIEYKNNSNYEQYRTGTNGIKVDGADSTYNGNLLQHISNASATFTAPIPGSSGNPSPSIYYRNSRAIYGDVDDDWTENQPVDAIKYKVKVSMTSDNFKFGNSATLTHELPDGETESEGTVYGDYEILPAVVSVAIPDRDQTVTYNGDAQTPTLQFTNADTKSSYVIPREGDGSYSITNYLLDASTTNTFESYEYNGATAPTDAGRYTVTVTLNQTDLGNNFYSNYAFDDAGKIFTKEVKFTIAPATIIVDITKELTYIDDNQQPTVSFTNEQRGNDEVPDNSDSAHYEYAISYAGDKLGSELLPKNAGAYIVTVILIGNGARNFNLKDHDSGEQTYDTSKQFIVDSEGTTYKLPANSDGQHKVKVGDAKTDGKFTIVPATVSPYLTVSDKDPTKMDTTSIEFNGSDHKAGVGFTSDTVAIPKEKTDYEIPESGDYELIYSYNGWYAEWETNKTYSNVGQYTLDIKLTEDGNYCFSKTGVGGSVTYDYDYMLSYNITHRQIVKEEIVFKTKNNPDSPDNGKPLYGLDKSDDSKIVGLDGDGNKIDIIYTGDMIQPIEKLQFTGPAGMSTFDLVDGKHYTISYGDRINVGTCNVTISGIQNFTGTVNLSYEIKQKSLGTSTDGNYNSTNNDKEIESDETSFQNLVYRGTPHYPTFLLSYNALDRVTGKTTTRNVSMNVDYDLEAYRQVGEKRHEPISDFVNSGVTDAGTYYLIARGKGNYTGIYVGTFTVEQATIEANAANPTLTFNNAAQLSGVTFTGATAVPKASSPKFTSLTDNKYDGKEGDKLIYTLTFDPTTGYTSTVFNNDSDGFKNAGTYTITVTLAENSNYKFANGSDSSSYTYKITPALINLNSFGNKTYNGTEQAAEFNDSPFTLSSGSFASGATLKTLVSNPSAPTIGYKDIEAGKAPINAGTYDVTVTLVEFGNFAFSLSDGGEYSYTDSSRTFTIDPFNLGNAKEADEAGDSDTILTFDIGEVTYTSEERIPEIKRLTINFFGGASDLVMIAVTDYSASYSNNVNASNRAELTINGTGNYTGSYTHHFTISAKSLGTSSSLTDFDESNNDGEIKATAATLVYNGKAQSVSLTVEYTVANEAGISENKVIVLIENTDYTIAAVRYENDKSTEHNIVNAGTYLILLQGKNNYTGIYVVELIVEQAEITVSAYHDSYTYDNAAHLIGVVFGGTTAPERHESVSAEYIEKASGQNEYTYEDKIDDKIIYTLYFSCSKEHGYDGACADGGCFKNAGTYTVTVTLPNNGNFKFADGKYSNTYEYKINPALITFSGFSNKTYNGAEQEADLEANRFRTSLTDVSGQDLLDLIGDVEITYYTYTEGSKVVVNPKDAGTYDTRVELKEGGNFAFSVDESGKYTYYNELQTFTIDKYNLSTGKDKPVIKVDPVTYTGDECEPTFTATITFSDSKVTETLELNKQITAAYSKNINVTDAAQLIIYGMGNFMGSADTTFTITAYSLGSSVEDKYSAENNASKDEVTAEPVQTYVYNGRNQSIAVAITYTAKLGKGDTDVQVNSLTVGVDYKLLVAYRHATDGTPTRVEIGSIVDAGSYSLLIQGLKNYTGIYVLELTIEKATVTVAPYDSSFIYTGGSQLSGAKFDGSVAPSAVASNTLSYNNEATYTYTNEIFKYTLTFDSTDAYRPIVGGAFADGDLFKNAGTYTVTVTFDEDGNYKFEGGLEGSYTYVINPVTATFNGFANKMFNGKDQTADLDKSQFGTTGLGEDVFNALMEAELGSIKLTYSLDGKDVKPKNADTYQVTIDLRNGCNVAFGLAEDGSYIYTTTSSFTIDQFDLSRIKELGASIRFDIDKPTYTGLECNPEFRVWIKFAGDEEETELFSNEPTVDFTAFYSNNVNATENDAKLTITGMGNYTGSCDASFEILQKEIGKSTEEDFDKEQNAGLEITVVTTVSHYIFNGSAQEIAVTMTYEAFYGTSKVQKNSLAEGVDYQFLETAYFLNGDEKTPVKFKKGIEDVDEKGIEEVGIYWVLIQGLGNYKGIYVLEIEVLPTGITIRAATESFTYDGYSHLSGVEFIAGPDTPVPEPVDFTKANELFKPQGDGTWVYTDDEYTLTINDTTGYKPFVEGAFESGNNFTNAGTYTVTVRFADGKNFEFAGDGDKKERTYTYTINPAVIAINRFESKTYNGKEQEIDEKEDTFMLLNGNADDLSASLLTLIQENKDTVTYEKGGKTGTPVDAGTYNVTYNLKNGGNFAFGRTTSTTYTYSTLSTFTINPFDLGTLSEENSKITVDACTYTGTTLTPDVVVTILDLGGDSHTLRLTDEYTVSYLNNVNAADKGDVTAPEAILSGTGNFSGTYTVKFTINKKSIGDGTTADKEMNVTYSEVMEYSGLEYQPNLTITYSPTEAHTNVLIMGDVSEMSSADYGISYLPYGEEMFDGVPETAGKYYILVSANNINYEGSFKLLIEITPAKLTLRLNGADRYIYTGISNIPEVIVMSNTAATPQVNNDYVVNAPTYRNDSGEASADHNNYRNAGTYTITVTIPEAGKNYVFVVDGEEVKEASVSYRILPARLMVSLNRKSAPYNGEGHDLRSYITFGNMEGVITPSTSEYEADNNFEVSYKTNVGGALTESGLPLTVGSYIVTVTLPTNGNFVIYVEDEDVGDPKDYILTQTLNYEIGQMSTSVTLNSDNLIYNSKDQQQTPLFDTDAVDPKLDYDIRYEYSLDGAAGTYSEATNFANAGTYRVTITLKNRAGYSSSFFTLIGSGVSKEGKVWTGTYTIGTATVHIQLNMTSATYNGKAFSLDSSFSFNNLDGNDGVVPVVGNDLYNGFEVAYSNGEFGSYNPVHAASYGVTVTLGKNFKDDGHAFTFTVIPQMVSVGLFDPSTNPNSDPDTWETRDSMMYDGGSHDKFDLFAILFKNTVDGEPAGYTKDKPNGDERSSYSVKFNTAAFGHDEEFSAAGIYTITVALKQNGDFAFGYNANYIYEAQLTFTIQQLDITSPDTRIDIEILGADYYYTGSEIQLDEDEITVRLIYRHKVGEDEWEDYDEATAPDDKKPIELEKGQYMLAYSNNVNAGFATVTVIGQGAIAGQDNAEFEIKPKPIGKEDGGKHVIADEFAIENFGQILNPSNNLNVFYYNGSQIGIAPTILYDPFGAGVEPVQFALQTTDYTLSWCTEDGSEFTNVSKSTPTDAGKYVLKVEAKEGGNYAGFFEIDFRILPAKITAELDEEKTYYTGAGQKAVIDFYYYADETSKGIRIPDSQVKYEVSYAEISEGTLVDGLPFYVGTYLVTVTLDPTCTNFVFEYDGYGLPDGIEIQKSGNLNFTIDRALVLAQLDTASVVYDGKEIDCKDYISIHAVSGGGDSTVWQEAARDFKLTYMSNLSSVSAPLRVGEYKITVTLDDPNLQFFNAATFDGKVSNPLTFTVLRASITPKEGGEFDTGDNINEPINEKTFNYRQAGRMESEEIGSEDYYTIIYDPNNPVKLDITASEAFNLFRTEDGVSIKYTVVGRPYTRSSKPVYEYTDSGVNFIGSGKYDVTVEVTSANYETAVFYITVFIEAQDIIITTEGSISTEYGTRIEDHSTALINAFLGIVTDIKGIPGNVTGLEEQKKWLRNWGLDVWVDTFDTDNSASGNLMAGGYQLYVALNGADNNARFIVAQNDAGDLSKDKLYEVTKKDVGFNWIIREFEYDAKNHYVDGDLLYTSGANFANVFYSAVYALDDVSFTGYTISRSTGVDTWEVIPSSGFVRNVGKYKIDLSDVLSGADSNNYSFGGSSITFEIIRKNVQISVSDVRARYGADFKTALAFVFSDREALEGVLAAEGNASYYSIGEIEKLLKDNIVLQAEDGTIVYGTGMMPPVGQYNIKLGTYDGEKWIPYEKQIFEDTGVYSNYSFKLVGQYGNVPYGVFTVYSVDVTVILNEFDVALAAAYGDYKYTAAPSGDETVVQDFDLTQRLYDYIFEDISNASRTTRRVRNITGLEEAYPEYGWTEYAELLKRNCWFEVVEPEISTGGYLKAGVYDLKILAREGCGFTVTFVTDYSGSSIGQSGANRLVIEKKSLDIAWAAVNDDVSLDESGNVSAIYTTKEYSDSPYYTNIRKDDIVGAPKYHFTDLYGNKLDTAPTTVGDYFIELDGIEDGVDNDCYIQPTGRTRLQIVPRHLTVNVHDAQSIYGDDFAALEFDVLWDWENRNDTIDSLNIVLEKESGKNAGKYSITGAWNNENYELTFVDGTYEIKQRDIEVTMDDLSSYYGDALKSFTFTHTGGSFAPGESLANLKVSGSKAAGNDAGEYEISGQDVDSNYNITVVPGTYTIIQADNDWLGEFSFKGWGAGYPPKAPKLPGAKFGNIQVKYYYDEDCTQEVEDINTLPEGEYYIKLFVEETNNYKGLTATYAFPVEHVIEATLYVIIFGSQFLILTAALIFIRRKKTHEDENNNENKTNN